MLAGAWLSPTTSDPDERKLRNVVEEMAIAAGVPVPPVYLLDEERASTRSPPATRPATPLSPSRRHDQAALPRRAAGRHRPRVQPHPQRRHAAEPTPDGRPLRHRLPRGDWPDSRSTPAPVAAGTRIHSPCLAWPCWPLVGFGVFFGRLEQASRRPPARISRRRLLGAVHPQPGGLFGRSLRKLAARASARRSRRPMPMRPATCSSATA